MSTGSVAIPQLKAAASASQIAERLADGPWAGLELALRPADIATDAAVRHAVAATLRATDGYGLALTAEAPVAWPSGACVHVERLTDEARACLDRCAGFAAAIGSPVLTLHLYAPLPPAEFRTRRGLDEGRLRRFLRSYADTCLQRGVAPLVENVPPVLRMRIGGVFLSEIGGHWRDLLRARELVSELGFTLDTSHAGLFRSFAAAYPSAFGLGSDEGLELDRYVDELGAHTVVAHVSDAHGLLGEGLPYGAGELDLDPAVARLAGLARYLVAEIAEPDPERSPDMKRAYRAIERAAAGTAEPPRQRPHRLQEVGFDWQDVLGRRDPVPSLLELQKLYGGRRILVTGGAGSVGTALTTFLLGFRPESVTVLDTDEAALTADHRRRGGGAVRHVLCDIRDAGRLRHEHAKARPDVLFHLAAYKHVDWAELYPEEFVDTNLQGSWNVLRAAEQVDVPIVVVASTDKAALAANLYGRMKRLMEQLTAFTAHRAEGSRLALRFVNVLESAGSASELFLTQARAHVPLTVTETSMRRYWITKAHAAVAAAQAPLLAEEGFTLAAAADAVQLTVGELVTRIWRHTGHDSAPTMDVVGIRPGETISEVLTAPGETIEATRRQGIAPIAGDIPTAAPAWILERLPEEGAREDARAVWLEALRRPGLLMPEPAATRLADVPQDVANG